MLENLSKNGGGKRVLRVTYVILLLAPVGIPYLFKEQLPGSWYNWTIFGMCLAILAFTFAQMAYIIVRNP
ncbi:MAG: hypothetical protein HXS52_10770 [Theionarchaea archaeon]|nr:hypothetical protein [Theionarchaea archaeon]MBU7038402.1 hypothetical protein [Theionarchaea archaeon]